MPKADCKQQQLYPAVLYNEGGFWDILSLSLAAEVLEAAKQRYVVPKSY